MPEPAPTTAAAPPAESEALSGSAAPVVAVAPPPPEPPPRDRVQPYDFRHPTFLPPSELRRLRLEHEEFVRALAARLSIYLRLEFALQMTRLEIVSYAKFTRAMPNPTCVSLFKIEPLRGVGLLEIRPRLGLAMLDRQLGGAAQAAGDNHEFSEIEHALLGQTAQLILGEWCQHWAKAQALRAVLLGHESNAQFLQTAPHDTTLLVLGMEAKLGDCTEAIQLALPCFTLEPIIRKLSELASVEPPKSSVSAATVKWNRRFDDVPVPVSALWDDLVLSAREIAALKAGDILPLDAQCTRQVILRLGEQSKFEGQLGTIGGKWAVSVTHALKPAADR